MPRATDRRRALRERSAAQERVAVVSERATFPIVKEPPAAARTPVVVSVPHYGTQPLPGVETADYREPSFATFAYGFADSFAAEVYGELHAHGATLVATPFSRMFVDVNRRRDDFEESEGAVRSRRGVVRTHTMRDVSIFARPLGAAELEERLRSFYDPYYAALERALGDVRQAHGYAILLDGHTGSPRRMQEHEVIIGTCRDATCEPKLAAAVADVFVRHGFSVRENVSGYTGGNVVATFGRPHTHVHALQVEINAGLLMTTTGEEFIAQVRRGERPNKNPANIARVRACLRDVIATLPSALTTG